jgi:hypothetical protein
MNERTKKNFDVQHAVALQNFFNSNLIMNTYGNGTGGGFGNGGHGNIKGGAGGGKHKAQKEINSSKIRD